MPKSEFYLCVVDFVDSETNGIDVIAEMNRNFKMRYVRFDLYVPCDGPPLLDQDWSIEICWMIFSRKVC